MARSLRITLQKDLLVNQFYEAFVRFYSILAEFCRTNFSLGTALSDVGENFDIARVEARQEGNKVITKYQLTLPNGKKFFFHLSENELRSGLSFQLPRHVSSVPLEIQDLTEEDEYQRFLDYHLLTRKQKYIIALAAAADENGFVQIYQVHRRAFRQQAPSNMVRSIFNDGLLRRVEGQYCITEELRKNAGMFQAILERGKRPLSKIERLIVALAKEANLLGDVIVKPLIEKIYHHGMTGLTSTLLVQQGILERYLPRRYRVTPWGRKMAWFYEKMDEDEGRWLKDVLKGRK